MEKINNLKKLFSYYGLDGYIVPKNDEFFSEYIVQNRDRLKFISNFSGSYGFALILKKRNYLFVDGRYTLQAKIQSGNQFSINTVPKTLPVNVLKKKKFKIGFDPKLYTKRTLKILFNKTDCKLIPLKENLIDKLWVKRENTVLKKFYILPKKVVGQSHKSKVNKLTEVLNKKKINFQFISAGENIAWLLNIRGQDSEFTPIPNAYLTLDINGEINLFCNLKKIDISFKRKFKNINFIDIKIIDIFFSRIKDRNILIDSLTCSTYFENILKKNNKIKEYLDPIYLLKSVKSKIEIKNTIKSHILDGAALTKFLFWVKKNYAKKNINEINAQEKLLQFRKKNKNFKSLSFPTISGSGPNGAIIHYKASKKSNRKLRVGDIYLVDSGAQYNFGTTDVTRTISLNNNSLRIKDIFTKVLQGHIAVASYKLKKNSYGAQVDKVARKPLNEINLDYAHGTGHGVGYFLNVHEGPQSISKVNKIRLKPGMVLSNEPGYYEKGKFGLRIENLIYVKKSKKEMIFDNITYAPIDKNLIIKKLLNKRQVSYLNKYHQRVYKILKKYMNSRELILLKKSCSNI